MSNTAADDVASGVQCDSVAAPLQNSIIYDNRGANQAKGCNFTNNIIQASALAGNLDAAPAFVKVGDYHLDAASPARDHAVSSDLAGLAARDLDRHARAGDGKPDLGAFEGQ
jgi:hypothetical protein